MTLKLVNVVFVECAVTTKVDIKRAKWEIKLLESHYVKGDNEHLPTVASLKSSCLHMFPNLF